MYEKCALTKTNHFHSNDIAFYRYILFLISSLLTFMIKSIVWKICPSKSFTFTLTLELRLFAGSVEWKYFSSFLIKSQALNSFRYNLAQFFRARTCSVHYLERFLITIDVHLRRLHEIVE